MQHNQASHIHKAMYIQSLDPGAVGAKVHWLDSSSGFVWKKRNDTNDGWDTIAILSDIGSGLTTEQVQDIVGAMFSDGAVDFTYDDTGAVVTNIAKTTICIACSDETTALTTGTAKVTFRMPHAMTLTGVRASLSTAQSSGSIFTVDINEGGSTILSTKITIDNGEKTSTTAAAAPVISDAALADDAEITIDIDQAGDGTATGLKVYLIGTRS